MTFFSQISTTFQSGGVIIYPLSLIFIISLAMIIDKILFYKKFANKPKIIDLLLNGEDFPLEKFETEILKDNEKNIYINFCREIFNNKTKPVWFIEAKIQNKASLVEKQLNKTLWVLETTITSAPLLGLLGTIIGMMKSFKLFGENNVQNISGITGGVSESLIATAIGIVVALIALFFFNYFTKKQDEIISDLENVATNILSKIKFL